VLFVIRTMCNPLRSRPSLPLTVTTIAIGFTVPPVRFLLFLVGTVAAYLALVEVAKVRLARRLQYG